MHHLENVACLFNYFSTGLIGLFSERAGHYRKSALLSNRITHLDKVSWEWETEIFPYLLASNLIPSFGSFIPDRAPDAVSALSMQKDLIKK